MYSGKRVTMNWQMQSAKPIRIRSRGLSLAIVHVILIVNLGCGASHSNGNDHYSIDTDCGPSQQDAFSVDGHQIIMSASHDDVFHQDGSPEYFTDECGVDIDSSQNTVGQTTSGVIIDKTSMLCRASPPNINAYFEVQVVKDQPSTTVKAYRPTGGDPFVTKTINCKQIDSRNP